jgi:NAD dependent epimerase/dehydratase family
MYAVNRDAALALARESLQAGARRFVQVSTIHVYGPGIGRPVREDDELRAPDAGEGERHRVYPHSKREAEEQIKDSVCWACRLMLDGRLGFAGFPGQTAQDAHLYRQPRYGIETPIPAGTRRWIGRRLALASAAHRSSYPRPSRPMAPLVRL